MQVKYGRDLTKSYQEVLLFLGDLAYAALDWSLSAGKVRAYVAAVVPQRSVSGDHWQGICRASGNVQLILDPVNSISGNAIGWDYIDFANGTITPKYRSQYQRIFGGGTNAKFVGLYKRPGKVVVSAAASCVSLSRWRVALYEVSDLHGPENIEQWWP
jgi:hypothetical protein